MARDEIRFSIPRGPNEKRTALEIMNELARRMHEEQEEELKRVISDRDPGEIIEGEVVDD